MKLVLVINLVLSILAVISFLGVFLIFSYLVNTERKAPHISKSNLQLTKEPLISIIIAAKNEEETIARCISSLQNQTYMNLEIIVVDDESKDRTLEIASTFRVRVISSGPKPQDWIGKSWPCEKGYESSTGEILLFVDADSIFEKEAIERSIDYFTRDSLDMFSISPRVNLKGPWAYSTLPLVSGGINLLYPMNKVNDPKSKRAYVFGTFILVRRSVYESIGGHASVKNTLVEDAALAQNLKSKGFKLKVVVGDGLIQTNWESDFKSIYHGMERVFSDSVRPYGLVSLLDALVLFFLGVYPFIFIIFFYSSAFQSVLGLGLLASLLNVLFSILIYVNELHLVSGRRVSYQALLYPLGYFLFMSAVITTAFKVKRSKSFIWKGENYPSRV